MGLAKTFPIQKRAFTQSTSTYADIELETFPARHMINVHVYSRAQVLTNPVRSGRKTKQISSRHRRTMKGKYSPDPRLVCCQKAENFFTP